MNDARTNEEIDGDMRIAVAFMATVLEQLAEGDSPAAAKAKEVLDRPAVALSVVAARTYLEDALNVRTEGTQAVNRLRLLVEVDLDDNADWGVGVIPGSRDELPPNSVISTVLTYVAREHHRLFPGDEDET